MFFKIFKLQWNIYPTSSGVWNIGLKKKTLEQLHDLPITVFSQFNA